MTNNVNAIPLNADKLLFVEDLLSFVVHLHNGIFYPTWRAGKYREFIYNAFNEGIKEAVEFLYESLEWEIDLEFAKAFEDNNVNELFFMIYARSYGFMYFNEGFEPNSFLVYCVRVASMAAYFIKYNVPEALDMALFSMLKVFEDYDMFQGGWEALNILAQRHMQTNKHFRNLLTPDVSDDDSMSDGSDEESDDVEEVIELNNDHEMEGRIPLIVLQEEKLLNRLKEEELHHGIAENNLNHAYSQDLEVESIEKIKSSEEDSFYATNASSSDETPNISKESLYTAATSSVKSMYVPEASELNSTTSVQYEIQIIRILNERPCQENVDFSNI